MDAQQPLITRTLFDNFINSIKSEVTKKTYTYLLNKYMKFLDGTISDNNNNNLTLLLEDDPKRVESNIIRYIIYLKQDQKLSTITINQYLAAIMHFYSMNDIVLNRRKIGKYMGDYVRVNKDRAYTVEEIHRLLEFCDYRDKAFVLLLASSGIRIGAVPQLYLRHLKKIEAYRLYQMTVYEGTNEEYYTFTTPEAASAIDTYLEFRQRSGEN